MSTKTAISLRRGEIRPSYYDGLESRIGGQMCMQNLKFVLVPEIIGGTRKKIGQSMDTPTLLFLQNFYGLLFGWIL